MDHLFSDRAGNELAGTSTALVRCSDRVRASITEAPETPATARDRILRRREVECRVGLRRSSIYELIHRGLFPAPVRLGCKAVGWLESEIAEWIADRSADRSCGGPSQLIANNVPGHRREPETRRVHRPTSTQPKTASPVSKDKAAWWLAEARRQWDW
jgi:prophage regulatory protein